MLSSGCWVTDQYGLMMDEVKKQVFSRMDANHHILSGFKALFSEQSMRVLDETRRVCGGAGYQSNSGLPTLWQNASPNVTLEGENMVMFGQATRYLVKLYRKVQQGKKVPEPFTYLNELSSQLMSKSQARST